MLSTTELPTLSL